MREIQANEATASRRRVYFHLVDGTDGITAETGEVGGQPQISSDGAAWTNTGIGVLVSIGNGRYYAVLTQTAVLTSGTLIETRYKSGNTAESPGDTTQVVTHDPDSIAASVWDKLRASHVIVGSFGESNQVVSSADVSVSFSFGGTGYCSRSDINDIFGSTNVTKWADLDNDADAAEITSRIARAIVWGTTEINDRLRGGPYTIPLPITAAATIVDLCATLAGVWLYRSRGVDDESEIDKYKWHWDRVEKTLSEIRGGKRRLDAPSSTDTGGQAPFAV